MDPAGCFASLNQFTSFDCVMPHTLLADKVRVLEKIMSPYVSRTYQQAELSSSFRNRRRAICLWDSVSVLWVYNVLHGYCDVAQLIQRR